MMKIIIIGCGRMGTELIHTLSQDNNDIVAIDTNTDVLNRLPKYNNVTYMSGVGFDKEVLENADISHADAVVSCTDSDETNALIGRIARNLYSVPKVIARQYNTKNAAIYAMLGVQTISTTEWGTRRVVKLLTKTDMDSIATIGNSDVEIIKLAVTPLLVGKNIETVNNLGVQVVSVLRNNNAFIPERGAVLEANDELYIAVQNNDLDTLKSVLGL
ncbi:TrkA family potassium uptake protein [Erysipelothrix sp. HDW6B]|uniref:potassium channel family protein n=1 Tax=Erysipelothrix TaxID=1647 RepID=UPI0013575794|nr:MULTISPECIES: TrkA family potassium uptake protein [Erysipelothrix]QIK86591.1 TrkA family potassium uptake protein [Erysipelothrix sp. HDW6B]